MHQLMHTHIYLCIIFNDFILLHSWHFLEIEVMKMSLRVKVELHLPFEVVRKEERRKSRQTVLCAVLQKHKVPLQQQLQKV